VHQPNETYAIHRGGQRRTILVALVTIAFVAIAIVKPWGGSVPTAAPSARPTVAALAQASIAERDRVLISPVIPGRRWSNARRIRRVRRLANDQLGSK
jgi:hypothetical protein